MDIETVLAKIIDLLAEMEGPNDKELKRVINISRLFLKSMDSNSSET
jgi:hypothetical protein